jgi:hypothetical protein
VNHFLLIDEGSYDGSTVFGIYDTFEAAREDAERRTAAKAEVEAQARRNRKPGNLGDPGPYVDDSEYDINLAKIQEWDGARRGKTWGRSYSAPLVWREYQRPLTDTH